jgi:hypothetical protein
MMNGEGVDYMYLNRQKARGFRFKGESGRKSTGRAYSAHIYNPSRGVVQETK